MSVAKFFPVIASQLLLSFGNVHMQAIFFTWKLGISVLVKQIQSIFKLLIVSNSLAVTVMVWLHFLTKCNWFVLFLLFMQVVRVWHRNKRLGHRPHGWKRTALRDALLTRLEYGPFTVNLQEIKPCIDASKEKHSQAPSRVKFTVHLYIIVVPGGSPPPFFGALCLCGFICHKEPC